MKKYISIFIAMLMLLGCTGCGAKDVMEELPIEEQISEVVVGNEILVGQLTAEGLLPNGLVAIYLNGEDAYDRLGDFSENTLVKHSVYYDYNGIGYTDNGAVMSIAFPEKDTDLTACMEEIRTLAKEEGFNEGECWIEYDAAKPPFLYSEGVMRNMFESSKAGDGICILAHFATDEYILTKDRCNDIVKTMAQRYGYDINESTLSAEDYRMCSNTHMADFMAAYGMTSAATSLSKHVPYFITCLQENTRCEGVAGAKSEMNAWQDDMEYGSRSSRTLATILGTDLLDEIRKVGVAEAERILDLGTDHIIQSNWGLVYTDVQGNFRVRLSLMVKDPEGKTGWYVTAYEVLVNPVGGDMFTSTAYEATGEIIQIIPYISFEKSLESGQGKYWKENGEQKGYDDGEFGLLVNEICHAFYSAGKLDQIKNEHPEWLREHENTCDFVQCHIE